ncbi:MAG: type II secretion system protein GspC [Desulfobacterales bacterium]|nr:type II secretion system protein GspC [Desulfobacterales bacterium]
MKYVFTLINMFLVVTIAYFCVEIIYKNVLPENFMPDGKYSLGTISNDTGPRKAESTLGKNQYDSIVKRNIFNAEIEEKIESSDNQEAENQEPEKLEVTTLKLVLWGTVTGEGQVYAVIEDKKVRQQALYEVGDSVQGAKVKKILRHEVILNHGGKDQVLEMETDNKSVSAHRKPPKKISSNTIFGNRANMDDPSDDINTLMKQVKMRPHFLEGEPDGLMVYGIRPNSVFRQIGLRNGDIIKDINGTQILSGEDASNLYAEIQEAENAKLTVFRRGKIKELFYQVKNGRYSIAASPEESE